MDCIANLIKALIFNFIFLLNKYFFNDRILEPQEHLYNITKNNYGLKKNFLNLVNARFESDMKTLLVDLKRHQLSFFLKLCHSIVPVNCSIFNRKLFNIVMLDTLSTYRGWCHFRGTPVRGQRTWTNAWSSYKSNGILRNYKLKVFKKYYGGIIPEKEITVAYVAETLNFVWRFQWDSEWQSAKNELLKFEGHPKTMKIDLYSMYNYQIIHPFKLNKMSKKQKQSFNKNYFSLGFDIGFSKVLLNERYKIDQDGSQKSTVSGASFLTRDERLNKKKKQKTKKTTNKPAVRSRTKKKSVWD